MAAGIRWIDGLGNVLEDGQYIGYYDATTKTCALLDGTPILCPTGNAKDIQPVVVESTPTYWWVLLIVFSVLVILLGWWINRKK